MEYFEPNPRMNDTVPNVSEIDFLTIPGNWWVGYLGTMVLSSNNTVGSATKGHAEQEYRSNLLFEFPV